MPHVTTGVYFPEERRSFAFKGEVWGHSHPVQSKVYLTRHVVGKAW